MFITALYYLMVLPSSGNAFLSENDPPEKWPPSQVINDQPLRT